MEHRESCEQPSQGHLRRLNCVGFSHHLWSGLELPSPHRALKRRTLTQYGGHGTTPSGQGAELTMSWCLLVSRWCSNKKGRNRKIMGFSANCNILNQLESLRGSLTTHSGWIPTYSCTYGLLKPPTGLKHKGRAASVSPQLGQTSSHFQHCLQPLLLHRHFSMFYLTLIKFSMSIFYLFICLFDQKKKKLKVKWISNWEMICRVNH